MRGFEEGITVKNADGSAQVVMMNENFERPDAVNANRSPPGPMGRPRKTR